MMEKSGNKALLMVRIVSVVYMLMGLYNLVNCFFDWQDLRYIPIGIVEIISAAMLPRLKNLWRIILLIDSIALGICLNGLACLAYHLIPEIRAELNFTEFEIWQMTYDTPVQIILNILITAVLLCKPVKKLFVTAR